MTEKTPIFCHFIIIIYQYCFSKKLIKIPNYSNMLIIQVYVNLTHKEHLSTSQLMSCSSIRWIIVTI